MSCVMCRIYIFIYIYIFFYKMLELVGGGSVINGATPYSYFVQRVVAGCSGTIMGKRENWGKCI